MNRVSVSITQRVNEQSFRVDRGASSNEKKCLCVSLVHSGCCRAVSERVARKRDPRDGRRAGPDQAERRLHLRHDAHRDLVRHARLTRGDQAQRRGLGATDHRHPQDRESGIGEPQRRRTTERESAYDRTRIFGSAAVVRRTSYRKRLACVVCACFPTKIEKKEKEQTHFIINSRVLARHAFFRYLRDV